MKKLAFASIILLTCISCLISNWTNKIVEKKCRIHTDKFKYAIVNIKYGYGCPPTGIDLADCPYPKHDICGGDVVGFNSPRFARIKYCPTCQQLKKRKGKNQ